jgi:hypothetical protein
MKRILLVYISALSLLLTGCLKEKDDRCLTLTFRVHDEYLGDSDFDSRIGNDVLLTAVQGNVVVSSFVIPSEDIHYGECTVKKPEGLSDGSMTLVAWSIPPTAAGSCYEPLAQGTKFDTYYVELGTTNAEAADHAVITDVFHEGITRMTYSAEHLRSEVVLSPMTCVVEVVVEGYKNLSAPVAKIKGTAGQADLTGMGCGSDVTREAAMYLLPNEDNEYETGVVSVLPSKKGETVSVEIFDGTQALVTLNAPKEMPIPATQGGYIRFHYEREGGAVTITVDDYTCKGEAVTM